MRRYLDAWFNLSERFPETATRNRAELVILVTLVAGLWGLAFAAAYCYLGTRWGLWVLLLDVLAVIALLALVLRAHLISTAGHLFCFALFCSVVVFSAPHPAYPLSALLWLMMIPILAYIFCSKRAAWLWSGAVLMAYVFYFVVVAGGYRLAEPMVLPVGQIKIDFISALGFFVVLLTLVWTYNRQLMESLEHSHQARELFAAARQEAELASAAKSDFLARMSHEMRTPLNAIIGLGDLLKDAGLSPEQAELNATLLHSSRTLQRLVEDLLDISAIESRKITIRKKSISLRDWLSQTVESLKPLADAKNLGFRLEIAADVPDPVYTDPARLSQILLNLLGNSVKFTRKGQIALSVHKADLQGGSEGLQFVITDTGIGISPEDQRRIFEPFYQARETVRSARGGAGLGLSISSRLVKLLGGSAIRVKSELGHGSTFSFSIPTAPPQDSEQEIKPKTSPGG